MKFPLKNGKEWELPPELYDLIDRKFPLVDIDIELDKLQTWLLFNDNRRGKAAGMKRRIYNWMSSDRFGTQAKRKPKVDKTVDWEKGRGEWLREPNKTKAQLMANRGFVDSLKDPEFRAWAEDVNSLVKEVL